MGNCGKDEGKPILLVFDCISFGKHEITTMDGLKLKRVLEELSRRIGIPQSKIKEILYKYEPLDKHKTIKDLNLPPGAVLTVKFSN